MHRMVKSYGFRQMIVGEAPFALAALVIAEIFYKFHSFVLEALAFLVTWYGMSLIADIVLKFFSRRKHGASHIEL